MVRHRCRSFILVLAATAPATAGAQWLPRPFLSIDSLSRAPHAQGAGVAGPTGAGPAVALGLVGGALGAFAGYAIGYPLVYQPSRERDLRRGCEDCGLGGAVGTMALMALGETIGVAVGAHLGNASAGNLGADLWTSFGALVLGGLVAGGLGSAQVLPAEVVVLTVPLTQIAAVVLVERHAAARRP